MQPCDIVRLPTRRAMSHCARDVAFVSTEKFPLPKWGCARANHARPAARRPLTRVSPTRRPPSSWRSYTRRSSRMSCASCCAYGAGSTASCPACAACRAPPGQTRPAAWATRPSRGSWSTACACAVAAASAPCPRCEPAQGPSCWGPGSTAAQLGGRRGRRPRLLTGRLASGLRPGAGVELSSPRVGPVAKITSRNRPRLAPLLLAAL